MTRFEFLLQAAIYIERAEPCRFRGFQSAAEALLLFAQRRGYDIDQRLMPNDIQAMLDAVDVRIAYYSCREAPPRSKGLVRNPQDAAVHFL